MTPWEENIAAVPELEDIKRWLGQGNKNDFLESIIQQADRRKLSDRQLESAKNAADKIKNPPKRITFDELDKMAYSKVLGYLANISPTGYDFYSSISQQIVDKGSLSEKQWDSVTKKFYRFRKSLLRKIFTGSTQK